MSNRKKAVFTVPGSKVVKMKQLIFVPLVLSLLALPACIHPLSMHSMDGEKLSGKWRFAREDTGLIWVTGSDGEVLAGRFIRVGRRSFAESYEKTFGRGSISVFGPPMSAFGGLFGSWSTLVDAAYGENLNAASGNSELLVSGPLFFWTASLQGDKGTSMACYFIGSSYTGHGFGRCKSHAGKDYSVEF